MWSCDVLDIDGKECHTQYPTERSFDFPTQDADLRVEVTRRTAQYSEYQLYMKHHESVHSQDHIDGARPIMTLKNVTSSSSLQKKDMMNGLDKIHYTRQISNILRTLQY